MPAGDVRGSRTQAGAGPNALKRGGRPVSEPEDIERYLITVNDAVAVSGASLRTVRTWISDGRLQRYRRDGDRMIRVDRRRVERLRQWRADAREGIA